MGLTKESLGIFWDGEEMDGVMCYAFWGDAHRSAPRFPSEIWPSDARVQMRRLYGDGWVVWEWDIRLNTWPVLDAWDKIVMRTLARMREEGAVVSWFGIEGCFADPPSLFKMSEMGAGVWACVSRGGIECHPSGLDEEFCFIPPDIFPALRAEVLGAIADTL
jgi:hypothetical protein